MATLAELLKAYDQNKKAAHNQDMRVAQARIIAALDDMGIDSNSYNFEIQNNTIYAVFVEAGYDMYLGGFYSNVYGYMVGADGTKTDSREWETKCFDIAKAFSDLRNDYSSQIRRNRIDVIVVTETDPDEFAAMVQENREKGYEYVGGANTCFIGNMGDEYHVVRYTVIMEKKG